QARGIGASVSLERADAGLLGGPLARAMTNEVSMSEPRYFEDFHVGQKFAFGHYEVTKAEILEFAKEFDPQPHHLDEEAAKHSMLGGLSASGWHVCAMTMRMVVDSVFGKAE